MHHASRIAQALANGSIEETISGQRIDGKSFSAAVTTTAIFDHDRQHIGFAQVVRVRASEVIATPAETSVDQARYRTLFESAPVGILYGDADSYYLDANAAICQMLGYRREELIGKHASEIIAPADVSRIQQAIAEIHASADHRNEWQFRRKDNSVFPANVIATKFADGTLLGMILDITAQKEHEREMSCVTRLYAALSQVNQAIVWSETREELFEKVCEVLVEHGGFSLAWIGWHDPETERLIPKAQYGTESGHLESVPVNGDDKPARRSVPERRRSAIRCSMIRSRDHG